MNENIDLTKILKDCPKGTKFYSTCLGEVIFDHISNNMIYPICVQANSSIHSFTKNGQKYIWANSECTIFPSRQQRDWSKFTAPWYKKERFDPKTLNPFDKILVKGNKMDCVWKCSLHSHFDANYRYSFCANTGIYKMCIPYNDDTKHLVGTTEEAPEFYRYWED